MTPNPTCCCCVQDVCCSNKLPDVLHGQFTNVSGCPNIDGVQVTLTTDAAGWQGAADCNGSEVGISLTCIVMEGGSCAELQIAYDLGCTVDGQQLPEPGCTCEPLYLKYVITGVAQPGCGCCNETEGVEVILEITD